MFLFTDGRTAPQDSGRESKGRPRLPIYRERSPHPSFEVEGEQMLGSIGPLEIGIVLVVALLVFGPKRLPELGSSLGQSMRGFGKGLKGEEDEAKPEVTEG
jgi:sec-independent protein translocase protein TatA